MEGNYVMALDVGTTTIRCHLIDKSTYVIGMASDQGTPNVPIYRCPDHARMYQCTVAQITPECTNVPLPRSRLNVPMYRCPDHARMYQCTVAQITPECTNVPLPRGSRMYQSNILYVEDLSLSDEIMRMWSQ
uniref:Uncharacterized protein n=1 Tax=Timema bartmani TaxID=61472 RepID=A0A7R9EQF2_9NEOP|nr:unnamed protein product [Timema bartmani]